MCSSIRVVLAMLSLLSNRTANKTVSCFSPIPIMSFFPRLSPLLLPGIHRAHDFWFCFMTHLYNQSSMRHGIETTRWNQVGFSIDLQLKAMIPTHPEFISSKKFNSDSQGALSPSIHPSILGCWQTLSFASPVQVSTELCICIAMVISCPKDDILSPSLYLLALQIIYSLSSAVFCDTWRWSCNIFLF